MGPIVGHQRAVGLLRHSIDAGHIAHAYLFSGPPQIGKTTLAIAFAQTLNCTGGEPPCAICDSCRRIARESHPDVRLIRVGDDEEDSDDEEQHQGLPKARRTIGIKRIRELRRDAALLPYQGRWKVYIIVEAHSLTVEAQNCLLKTLEQPPAQVVLVLTALDAGILLPTVASRCQKVELSPLPVSVVQEALQERWHVDHKEAEQLAHLSGGRLGWAVTALLDRASLEERAARLAEVVRLTRASRVDRFAYAERLAARFSGQPEVVTDTLDLWLGWWRDLLLVQNGCPEMVTNWDQHAVLEQHSSLYSHEELLRVAKAIRATQRQLEQNVNPRLALEVLLLSLPGGASGNRKTVNAA